MFDTVDQILRRLRAGEDSRVEFSRVELRDCGVAGPDRDNLAAGLVAFANAEGGTFLLGVDDSGKPTGIRRDKLDVVEQWVVNIATDLCDPPIRPVLRRAVVPGPSGDVTIILAEIRRGYGGTDLSSDDLVHAERLTGPASDQIDAGVAFVMHYMRSGRPSDAGEAYDIDVVDEAVVNAVAHRDYSVSGSKIRLFLFSDRLELYSPGKLPNGLEIEETPYRTFTRNQLLVSFLSKMRSKRTGRVFLESRGEGLRDEGTNSLRKAVTQAVAS